MKKLFFILLVIINSFIVTKAESYSYTFEFNPEDFLIEKTSTDSVKIFSTSRPAIYPGADKPAIPFYGRSIAIPGTYQVSDINIKFNKQLLRDGVDLCNSISPLETNVSHSNITPSFGTYETRTYPDNNCILSNTRNYGNVSIVSFLITPFIFDASKRELYFVDSFDVELELIEAENQAAISFNRPHQMEMLQDLVENKEIFAYLPQTFDESFIEEQIDYIIITSNSFKNAFTPLANWKKKKGIRSKIITVDEIYNNYSGASEQIKIKSCIKEYFENKGTQFVLLGGDVEIVPTLMTYFKKSNQEQYVPTDLFYSSLNTLDWDTNKDGKSGDPENDKVDSYPVIAVTRAPARTVTDVTTFVNRIIEYEKAPKINRSFLMAGGELTYNVGKHIYGETIADMIFNYVISGKIRLGATKVFDTFTTSGEPFSTQLFQNELSNGHQYAEIICHGGETDWTNFTMETKNNRKTFYTNKQAAELNNIGHTLISTTACETNHFDMNESPYISNPCLSETFLRNPNSGIIAYIGASRTGIFNPLSPSLDFSPGYDKELYDRLLNTDYKPVNKHLGTLMNHVKASFLTYVDDIASSDLNYDDPNTYRWLHYGINVLGDPETPIYSTYPMSFNNATTIIDGNHLEIITDEADTKICISSRKDDSFYKINYGTKWSLDLPKGEYDIYLTKQNFIPKWLPVYILPQPIKLPSKIISISPNPASTFTNIRYQATDTGANNRIVLINTSSNYTNLIDLTECIGSITVDLSNFPKGIYIVAIECNGQIIEGSDKLIIN